MGTVSLKGDQKNSTQAVKGCVCVLQPWATWMASGCTGSLCASLCPNTQAFSFLAKGTRTRAWPKTTATPPCTASRSPAPRIIPTSSRLLPPYTFPTFRKSFRLLQTERCGRPQNGEQNCIPQIYFACVCSPSVVEDDLKMLFASSGAVVKAFKFFQ